MSLDLVVRGGTVFTQNATRQVLQADVRVVRGRIAEIGANLPVHGAARVIDARGKWVMPGFIQAHMHLTQTLLRGLADDRELLPWLRDRIWPLEAAHTPETNYISAELGLAEMLASGTTTLLDMGTTHHHDAVFEAARGCGIRYFGGKALMDQGEGVPEGLLEDTDRALASCDAQIKRWHGTDNDRLRFVYAPRFILSCSDTLLTKVGERSRAGGFLIHTHASENRGEIEAVRAVTGSANLRALQKRGCLHDKTVLAHGVHVEGDEEECLVESGASVCHCPGSNLKLASGISPVPRLLSRGVQVALGADGAACNNTVDQRMEMRLTSFIHRLHGGPKALSAQQVLDLATLGGAAALGMAKEIGSLEVGKRADVICIEPTFALEPVSDLVSAFVYGATSTRVTDVIIDGIPRVCDGRVLDIDTRTLGDRARKAQAELLCRAKIAL
jgi:5-methylthioadenosine/S-adenosylhomocysteine deaminase